ncbi:MAG: pilus assembly protein PilM [Phycisphaerales bacterium]|nr:pilus assembly protein PilM [Phycisphaerales bacterium]
MGLLNLKRVSRSSLQRALGAPIGIDFGASSLKVLQVSSEAPPSLVTAGCVDTPENLLHNVKRRIEFQMEALPGLVQSLPLKGRRAVCAIPSALTFCKHAQFVRQDGLPPEVLADTMLTEQLGRDATTLVRRLIEVREADRTSGTGKAEYVCLATGREVVEKLMKSMRAAKLEPVGMHSEFEALLRAFGEVNRREADANRATVYLDLGCAQTRVIIAHGTKLVFARSIELGGYALDECLSKELACTFEQARRARLSMADLSPAARPGAPRVAARATGDEGGVCVEDDRRADGVAPGLTEDVALGPSVSPAPAGASLSEPLEILTDEIGMCIRYHDAMFRQSRVTGVVFVGGEARHRGLCQHIAKTLRLPAQVADPLARFARTGSEKVVGVDLRQAQPGWTVAVGLCLSPTDL